VTGKVLALDESLKSVLPAFLSLLDLSVEDAAWQALDPAQRRRRTLDAVKALLLRESEEQSLVVMFENLHWADGETLELLSGLIDSLPTRRILLLVNYRPEFHHDWVSRGSYAQVRVDPLPTQSTAELLDALLGSDLKSVPLKCLLTDKAKGNPLFIEESVHALVEAGTLVGETGAYSLTREIDAIEVPATVQAIIAARVDRLPPETKLLLQSAAAIGHHVPYGVLQAIADMPEDQTRQGLSNLQAAEFLYETRLFPDLEYAFKHAFTHEVAYSGVLRDRRRELHRRVGEAIERLYPDRHVAFAESLADHFEQGEVWSKAALHYFRAADKAKNQWAYGRGAGSCRKALGCLEHMNDLKEEKRRVLVMLGDLLSLVGKLDQANESYERALALTEDDPGHRFIDNKRHRPGCAVREGARIAYYEHGSGDDVLVLVSPLAYDTTAFQPLVETLCQQFRVVQIFARGTGPSDPAPYPYRLEQHVEDARAVIETLAARRRIAIGVSDSGSLLVRLVCACPTLLHGIVLVGTGLGDICAGTPFEQPVGAGEMFMKVLESEGVEAAATMLVSRIFSEPGTRDLAEVTIGKLAQLRRDTWLNFIDPGPELEIAPLLAKVAVPTLVAYGTEDRVFPVAQGRYIASHIAGAQFYAFEGKGHLPIFTATNEFCDVLCQFVRTGTVSEPATTT
jgi:pimeloyl-ACP methyl ester carboxylesterase